MTRHTLRRPSPSMLVALAALFVAIGGSALGAIAAIPQNDRFTACYQTSSSVLDRIVLLAEPGEACPNTYARVTWPATASGGAQGPPGPQGPQGPQGPPGNASTAVLSTSVVARQAVLGSDDDMTVMCPSNRQAVGGGADAPGESFPVVKIPKGKGLRAVAVGWTFRLKLPPPQVRLSTAEPYNVSTNKASFPEHRHSFTLYGIPRTLVPRVPRARPVTAYVICARMV